jgi:hypothetical protein
LEENTKGLLSENQKSEEGEKRLGLKVEESERRESWAIPH